MSSPTLTRKQDRRKSDAERIEDLEQARRDFTEALVLYTRTKARLKQLVEEEKD